MISVKVPVNKLDFNKPDSLINPERNIGVRCGVSCIVDIISK